MNANVIMDAKDIGRALTRIAHEIIEVHKGVDSLVVIGVHTRGVHLARRLCEKIAATEGRQLPAGTIDINLYRDDWTKINRHPVVQSTHIDFPLDDRQVILVDDVLFTGRTTRAALEALLDFGRPARVELAVLVDRGLRELPIQPDYVGKVIKTDLSQMVNVMLSECDDTEMVVVEEEGPRS
ncbi:MAG: bifunctional pyr operon transcriptional regulator/uracil phosphoribosyltransferase PyrR [Thermodesulfobacteriota bacterium]|nr:bifunctional pyr operon transcriptional regulator/uracil phosphoribosyltransferase PyrR [Thermodesulfobacteriota bacterium]